MSLKRCDDHLKESESCRQYEGEKRLKLDDDNSNNSELSETKHAIINYHNSLNQFGLKFVENTLLNFESPIRFVEEDIEIRFYSIENELIKKENELFTKFDELNNKLKRIQLDITNTIRKYRKKRSKKVIIRNINDIYKYETKLESFKSKSKVLSSKINEFKYIPSELNIFELDIGKLSSPYVCKYENMISMEPVTIPFDCCANMEWLEDQRRIVITDINDKTIKLIDIDGKFYGSFNPGNRLETPCSLCISDKNEIFVQDQTLQKVFVYDEQLNYLREFGDSRLQMPFDMVIHNPTYRIFMTAYLDNLVTIWDGVKGVYINEFELNFPTSIKIRNEKLYVMCAIEVELFRQGNFEYVNQTVNSLYVYDIYTLKVLKVLKLDYKHPKGLQVDIHSNIYITGYDSTCTDESSKLLIKLDENGNLVKKLDLTVKSIFGLLCVEKRLILLRAIHKPPIYILGFE